MTTETTPTTAPVTPAPAAAPTGYLAWFKAHEKLLVIILACIMAWHFWGTGLEAWSTREKRIADSADAANVLVQSQLKDLKNQNDALNAKLDASMAVRAVQTKKQKAIDAVATPSDLAVRIVTLLQAGHVTVDTTPTALPGTLVFDPDAAHKVAADEEDLVQIKADNIDLTTKYQSCVALGTQKDAALVAEQTSHTADVNAEKANSKVQYRKGLKRGFKIGAIVGFLGGLFVSGKI